MCIFCVGLLMIRVVFGKPKKAFGHLNTDDETGMGKIPHSHKVLKQEHTCLSTGSDSI